MKKVRLTLIAAAVLLSVGGAYATKSESSTKATLYDVLSTNPDGTYTVQADQGTGECDTDPTPACKVTSNQTPVNGKISQSGTTIQEHGNFMPD